jgi:uncharacterized protein (DUF934 family)
MNAAMSSNHSAPLKLLVSSSSASGAETAEAGMLTLANDSDPRAEDLAGITLIELQFPKFTDGRAFSQAFLLRRRLGFQGDIRATGDVLADQLQQMARSGFSSAVLRADQNLDTAQRQLDRFSSFYQGDAVHTQPHFASDT